MKKVLFTFLTVCLAFTIQAQDMSLEEVLAAHYEVMGQDKLSDVNTVTYEGKMVQMAPGGQSFEFPIKLQVKRPGKFRFEGTVQNMLIVQAYDGESGFMLMPNSPDPQDMSDDQIESMKDMGSVDLTLFTAEKDGHEVELVGKEEFEGSDVYLVKVTKENGDEATYFIDAENFVILKTESKTMVQDQEVNSVIFFSNYKEAGDGIIFPYSQEVKNPQGQTNMAIMIDTIELNSEVSDDAFVRPE